jgi:signal transduction histidine kinase
LQGRNRELSPAEKRILVLAPTGRDGQIAVETLVAAGAPAAHCGSLEDLLKGWDAGAGVLMLAEEAITHAALPEIQARLERQPDWSDIPIVILTGGGSFSSTRQKALDAFATAGNVTFLERPFRKATLLSVAQVAQRSRARQYQLRDNLERLRKGEERLRLALDAGRIAVWEYDVEIRRFACTERLYSFAGVGPDGFGETLEGFAGALPPADAAAFRAAVERAVATGQDFELEIGMRGPGPDARRVQTRGQPVRGPGGGVIRVAGAAIDITERLRAEEELRRTRESLMQSQKLEAIGKLAGGIAHDFNNMLTAINGYGEILLPSVEDRPELAESVGEILKAGRRAAALTHQLLAYSRRQIMTLKAMDINAAVTNMTGMLQRLIPEDIRTDFRLGSDLPPIVADLSQVEQIILNLVLNARDALPKGGNIRVATSVLDLGPEDAARYPEAKPGRYVRVEVADDGIGMTADVRARIFDPFFTTKPMGQGTGMGLSTVYGIVKQSSGHIRVESEPGRGSIFTVLFPAAPERPRDADPVQEKEGGFPLEGANLLVVEDEPPVRSFLKTLLEGAGFTVLTAAHGESALELEASYGEAIHLLITDIVMPGMNGRELADRVAARRPGIRVLYISGFSDDDVLQDRLDEDRAFLAKPFTSEAVLSTVRGLLAKADRKSRG